MMTITTTTGKFSVEVKGTLATEKVAELAKEGLLSMIFRKAFPKTELLMAKSVGKTKLLKSGELAVEREGAGKFKRDEVNFSKSLAGELQKVLQEFVTPYGEPDGALEVVVGEYVATASKEPAQVTMDKAFKAALGALDGMKEFLPDGIYDAQLAKLKVQYNQVVVVDNGVTPELDEEMAH